MTALNIEDLRLAARRRLPRIFFDYLDGGSHGETTMHTNVADFERWTLQPRVLRDISKRDLSATFLGGTHALPLMLGPIGFAGMFSHRGEIAAAEAAASAGIPTCLSSFAVCSLEEVAATSNATLYYQVYVFRERELTENMIARAERAGVEVLFLTVDTAVTPLRERDARNGFRGSTQLNARLLLDFALHPRWCIDLARGGAPELGNVKQYGLGQGLLEQASNLGKRIDPALTWADLAWFRERWRGRLVVKGIMSPDDAKCAVDAGADAIVVSNHGGRQLDGAPSTVSVLPSIVQAVGTQAEIIFDGGIRRGAHIVRALALGADAVLLGRAYAFGLAAKGEQGVREAIAMLSSEMDSTMALMGITDINSLRELGQELIQSRD